jgi:thiol-disulfide isomerase/thioredoxin
MALVSARKVLALGLAWLSGGEAAKETTPHFKWGQTKEMVFLSVMVRDLDKNSVEVSAPDAGEFSFTAKSTDGEKYYLKLALREDIKPDQLRWEITNRPDKWGIPVLVTLAKVNQHRWDLLVGNPKAFKGLLDKDWTREDQTLDPEEEVQYVEDHSGYLKSLTTKNMEKTLKSGTVIVNVRYPWCTQCKSQDDTFAKAAKIAKSKAKKEPTWKKAVFAVLDAREERSIARKLGAKCDYTCEYQVYAEGPGYDSVPMKSKWSETDLLSEVVKYLSPAVEMLKSAGEAGSLKEKNTTCVGLFSSDTSAKYKLFKKIAGMMRGDLVFAAAFGEEAGVELFPFNQSTAFKYDGTWEDNGTALMDWMRPRAIPLLQEYDWQLREVYEKVGLPIVRLWLDDKDSDPSNDKIVRHVVRRLAKTFIGKLAFVELKKSMYSYELRDYGLNQPEVYPAIGIGSNASYNAIKYGFEVTPEVAASNQEFWKDADKAVETLTGFCEQVLAGTWPQAHESGTPQAAWTAGQVKTLVWKTFKEIALPQKPLLLEMFGKYRTDNEKKTKEVENLAKALEPHADKFIVASYDSSDNHVPSEFKREKYSSDTVWYWVPAAAGQERPPIVKLMKPKKEAPIKKVLQFLKKQSDFDLDTDALNTRFEELMKENPPPTPPSSSMPDDEPEDDDDAEEEGELPKEDITKERKEL